MKLLYVVVLFTLVNCSGSRTDGESLANPDMPAETTSSEVDLDNYPSAQIANEEIHMKIYLPDPQNGLYRATRFDWSGVIGSTTYQGHEYFGYWKDTHDPTIHEDLTGPVEGYIEPGLGFNEAKSGGGFIRIGVGILEKEEPEYKWTNTFKILDHGKWNLDQGDDWITFTHEINSDFGYAYIYEKTIALKNDGFTIGHKLQNTGSKSIETDQFNHNFFMIDGETSGPAFTIEFPYDISTEDELKDLMAIEGRKLHFNKEFRDTSLFMTLTGYSDQVSDHRVTVVNSRSGAGVTLSMDQPIYRMCFWACETTLCPENFIWISVPPGKTMEWSADYTLFVDA